MDLIQRTKLRCFVIERLPAGETAASFKDSDSLFLGGRLSSFDALELIMFLESEFGVDLADADFEQTKLDTVDSILELVDECQGR